VETEDLRRRTSFVSNSSSASFFVCFESTLPWEKIDAIIEQAGITPSMVVRMGAGFCQVKTDTLMFNDYGDVQGWQLLRALYFGAIPQTTLSKYEVEAEHEDEEYVYDFRSYGMQAWNTTDDAGRLRASRYEAEYFDFLTCMYEILKNP
jgi:hypothetical protein